MYCYYPNDEGWPGRASVVHADPSYSLHGFSYDDYFTYKGGLNGTRDDERSHVCVMCAVMVRTFF